MEENINQSICVVCLFVCCRDENYFKDLKVSQQTVDKNLWLVNLVQLKKLFLKLSAYVELYLKQDWSLLPVPDFKLVARSEEETSHLNFMVAAVLLTATHSGRNLEYQKILEFSIPSSIRRDIQTIQDSFLMALEPKSPKSQNNSPRKTSLTNAITNNTLNIVPKVLFPTTLSLEVVNVEVARDMVGDEQEHDETEFEIKLQEIKEDITVEEKVEIVESIAQPELINLQNEIKLLEIRLAETEKALQKSKQVEETHAETIETLKHTQQRFKETCEELQGLREQREYEKIERNSLLAGFDQEKQTLQDEIDSLKQQLVERNSGEMIVDKEQVLCHDALQSELDQCKIDNSRLVNALKKARDHIIKQDTLIKDLNAELSGLKFSHEQERTAMNRVLTELGSAIQQKTL